MFIAFPVLFTVLIVSYQRHDCEYTGCMESIESEGITIILLFWGGGHGLHLLQQRLGLSPTIS